MTHKHSLEKKSYPGLLISHPFHRLIRDFWGDDLDLFDRERTALQAVSNVSLSEDETHVYVDAALPGLSENEIEVTLEKGVLWIRGHKNEVEDKKKYHYKASRSYSYQLALPENVDEKTEPKAHYEKGILHITFDKSKGEVAKKICVKCSDR